MAEIQKIRSETSEIPEIQEAPPFVIGSIVRVKHEKSGEMIDIVNRGFGKLKFGKSQHKVLAIEPRDNYWAIELSGLTEGDLLNANDFELVPEGGVYKEKNNFVRK